jgi:hypothetical protein
MVTVVHGLLLVLGSAILEHHRPVLTVPRITLLE